MQGCGRVHCQVYFDAFTAGVCFVKTPDAPQQLHDIKGVGFQLYSPRFDLCYIERFSYQFTQCLCCLLHIDHGAQIPVTPPQLMSQNLAIGHNCIQWSAQVMAYVGQEPRL